MNEEKVLSSFLEGFNCSQVVLSSVSGELGLDDITAKRISACFGSGMSCGSTCGAITGALMAIGFKYGNSMPNTPETNKKCITKLIEFREKFSEKYDSVICSELLGYNISVPKDKEKIIEKQLLTTFCPKLVSDVISTLKDVI